MGQVWNSTLTRRTPLKKATKPLKRSTKPIAKVTKKRAAELRLYEKAKKELRTEDTCCQFPGCERTDLTCHHVKGRLGKMVYNKKYLVWLCPEHHTFAEENPTAAKKLKVSANRLDKL